MSRRMMVAGQAIDDHSACFVIAEIGHNHQGDVRKCMEIFRAAKECGASAVKLQKRDNRTLFTRQMYDSVYNSENAFGPTYGSHREALEFGRDEYLRLKDYAAELDILFFATAFDLASADFLAELDMPAYKLASGDLTNIPLLKHVAGLGRPMFVSTGGGSMEDVERAYDAVRPQNDGLCLMQCTAGYPPAHEELNLSVITRFRERFPDTVIGYSGHDSGIAMGLAAYMLGARVLEKHFTLNRAWKGTDHAFSLERPGLQRLVRDLQRAREAIGDGIKRRYPSEEKPLYKMAKKLVAARDLPAGHVLREADIAARSPNDGLPPYRLPEFLGRRLTRPLLADEGLTFEAIGQADGAPR